MWLVKGVFPSFDLLFLLELMVEYYFTIGTAGQAICSLALLFLFFFVLEGEYLSGQGRMWQRFQTREACS